MIAIQLNQVIEALKILEKRNHNQESGFFIADIQQTINNSLGIYPIYLKLLSDSLEKLKEQGLVEYQEFRGPSSTASYWRLKKSSLREINF